MQLIEKDPNYESPKRVE
jgi:hypothetical protein